MGWRRGRSAVTTRGDRTRERILDAAERLYGERSVEAVSLREVRLAAGQRNSSALQFHFGDRDGLLLALTQRHLPRVGAIQQGLYDEAAAGGRLDDGATLVEVMVRPTTEYLQRGPGARAWIKISAERSARPDTAWSAVVDHAPTAALEVGAAIHEKLCESMRPALALERIISVSQACQHLCADRARVEDSSPDGVRRRNVPFDTWSANLVDMAVGAMFAPVGVARPTSH